MSRLDLRAVLGASLAAALAAGCVLIDANDGAGSSGRSRARLAATSNTPEQIASLAADLEGRAEQRIQLGAIRVIVEPFDEVEPEVPNHRFGVLADRERRATIDTLRHELTLALGNSVNVVDPDALFAGGDRTMAEVREATRATHAVVGTWYRVGDGADIDVAARLVDLSDGWIVATAQRRIAGFEGRLIYGDRGERGAEAPRRTAVVANESSSTGGDPGAENAPAVGAAAPDGAGGGAAPRPGDVAPPAGAVPGDVPADFDLREVLESGAVGPGASRIRGSDPPKD